MTPPDGTPVRAPFTVTTYQADSRTGQPVSEPHTVELEPADGPSVTDSWGPCPCETHKGRVPQYGRDNGELT